MPRRKTLIWIVVLNTIAAVIAIAWAELSVGSWSLSFFYDNKAYADKGLREIMVDVQRLCRRIETPLIVTNAVWFCAFCYLLIKTRPA